MHDNIYVHTIKSEFMTSYLELIKGDTLEIFEAE